MAATKLKYSENFQNKNSIFLTRNIRYLWYMYLEWKLWGWGWEMELFSRRVLYYAHLLNENYIATAPDIYKINNKFRHFYPT